MAGYLAIDCGTTNVKAMLVTNDGMWAMASAPTPWEFRNNLRVLDPKRLIDATYEAIAKTLGTLNAPIDKVVAIGVTSMGEVGLYVHRGEPQGYIGAWQDRKASLAAYESLLSMWDRQQLFERSGIAPNPKFGIFRMKMAGKQTGHWLSVADFVVWHLTGGARVTHASLAARTMAYDWKNRAWEPNLLDWAQVDVGQMPTILTDPRSAGVVVSDDRRLAGAEVIHAGHDHITAAFGAGLQSGELMDSTGTAEPLVIRANEPTLTPEACRLGMMWGQSLFDDRSYHALVPTPGGGAPEEWARELLALDWSDLAGLSAKRSTSVHFDAEKWLAGASSWEGLGYATSRLDMYWSVLDGVASSMVSRVDDLERLMNCRFDSVKVVGGVAKHTLWLDVRANHLHRQQRIMRPHSAALVGAIRYAARAVGTPDPIRITWRPHEIS